MGRIAIVELKAMSIVSQAQGTVRRVIASLDRIPTQEYVT